MLVPENDHPPTLLPQADEAKAAAPPADNPAMTTLAQPVSPALPFGLFLANLLGAAVIGSFAVAQARAAGNIMLALLGAATLLWAWRAFSAMNRRIAGGSSDTVKTFMRTLTLPLFLLAALVIVLPLLSY